MRRKRSGWNIVVAGFWNRLIFTPEWVIPRLFQEPQIETLVALLLVLPLIYQSNQVSFEITTLRLNFRPRQPATDESLLQAEQMARTVLQALPETPLQAVGVNFSYREENPPPVLVEMFNNADDADLAEQQWAIGDRIITRKLTREDRILNLTMTYANGSVTFDFNFHSETTTNAAALAAVADGRAVNLRNDAIELLERTYHLELDNEEDIDE